MAEGELGYRQTMIATYHATVAVYVSVQASFLFGFNSFHHCALLLSPLCNLPFRPSQTGDPCLYHHALVHMLGINQNRFAEGGRGGQWAHKVAVARAITSLGREELESGRQAQQCP